jgi:hypothetical protein
MGAARELTQEEIDDLFDLTVAMKQMLKDSQAKNQIDTDYEINVRLDDDIKPGEYSLSLDNDVITVYIRTDDLKLFLGPDLDEHFLEIELMVESLEDELKTFH